MPFNRLWRAIIEQDILLPPLLAMVAEYLGAPLWFDALETMPMIVCPLRIVCVHFDTGRLLEGVISIRSCDTATQAELEAARLNGVIFASLFNIGPVESRYIGPAAPNAHLAFAIWFGVDSYRATYTWAPGAELRPFTPQKRDA